MKRTIAATVFSLVLSVWLAGLAPGTAGTPPPNIIFILFDDLGYGQPPSYRQKSEFKTPSLDRLAREGMLFTDAHSAASVCTPTRYGVITGRYPWRIAQFGVLTTFSPPIDALDRHRLAENTLVIASSDNGAAGRVYECKTSIYEGGHREPLDAGQVAGAVELEHLDHRVADGDHVHLARILLFQGTDQGGHRRANLLLAIAETLQRKICFFARGSYQLRQQQDIAQQGEEA